MRYYSTQRPIMQSSFPALRKNKVLTIVNFNEPKYCREVDRDCFGYIEYETPLTEKEMVEYELVRDRLLDFSQRYEVTHGTSFLRTFATAKELNEWFDAQIPLNRHFCRLRDSQKRVEMFGSEYMRLKPENRWHDDPQIRLF